MKNAGEWFIEELLRIAGGDPINDAPGAVQCFGDDFEACFAQAKVSKHERGSAAFIRVHVPAYATDEQRQRLRQEGFSEL